MTESEALFPVEPLIVSADLPAVGGQVGPDPEDFVVDELPRYQPVGKGDHLWVCVRKRGRTTPELVQAVARAAGVRERDVGHAGMKDKHGVTSQWVSLPAGGRAPDAWRLPDDLQVLQQVRHTHKLRTGQLNGNRFRIRLVGVAPDAHERAAAIGERLRTSGLPNFFGIQRFGRGSENLRQAVQWLQQGAPQRGRKTRLIRKLYPSVVQAEVFNRVLRLRLQRHALDTLLTGDVVRLDGSRSVFVVEDAAVESPRLLAGELHVTGPIIGPKMKQPSAEPAAIEAAALRSVELGDEALAELGKLADGTRRDLSIRVDSLDIRELGPGQLGLDFVLPPGAYATQLVRELTHGDWHAPGARRLPASTPSQPAG